MRKKRALTAAAAALAAMMAAAVGAPRLAEYEIESRAAAAGYDVSVDSISLKMWGVSLRGVRAEGRGVKAEAEEVETDFDRGLEVRSVTIRKMKAEVRKEDAKGEKKGERGRGRPSVTVEDSTISFSIGGASGTAKVQEARMNPGGRVWAKADVEMETAGISASLKKARVEDLKPGSTVSVVARRAEFRRKKTGEGKTGASEPREMDISVAAEDMAFEDGENRAEAKSAKVQAQVKNGSQTVQLRAAYATMSGVTAQNVLLSATRARSSKDTQAEMTADQIEAEYQRLSSAEMSIKKVRVRATISQSEDGLKIEAARVKVGGATADLSATISASRAEVSVEMPEVGCQELLESLPIEMVPRLRPEGEKTELEGSLQWRAHVQVDFPKREKPDVSIWMKNRCVVKEVPTELRVQALKRPFRKEVYTSSGERKSELTGPGTKDWVPLLGISPYMPLAVMAMEDPSFMSHRGIVIQAIENSMEQNITAGKFVRGGSTISMQLAKNLWLAREKTISRKVQEAVLTTYLEQKLTKDQILEYYLNVVEFGPDLYGIGPAARRYFSKDPSTLTLSQSLFLASLLPSPRTASFDEGKSISSGRLSLLRKVMKMMMDRKTITEAQYERGLKETPVYGAPSPEIPESEALSGVAGGIDPSEWR